MVFFSCFVFLSNVLGKLITTGAVCVCFFFSEKLETEDLEDHLDLHLLDYFRCEALIFMRIGGVSGLD